MSSSQAQSPVAVWMLNMGGPDSPEAVQPFLRNLLADSAIIMLPFGWVWQWLFAWVISHKRAREVRESYVSMGGASPQLSLVREQSAALQLALGEGYECRPVFRYWGEDANAAADALVPDQTVVLLSLYPQASHTTSGSSIDDARAALKGHGGRIVVVASYPDQPDYVTSFDEHIQEALAEAGPDAELLFSAHGLPVAYIDAGDPYLDEIKRTVAAVSARFPNRVHHLSFQSRVGVQEWLSPSTLDKVQELGEAGKRSLVVVPVAFTSDHIETLVEIGEEIRDHAQRFGVDKFVRVSAQNTHPSFIAALKGLTERALMVA